MKRYQGVSLSPGFAEGFAVVYHGASQVQPPKVAIQAGDVTKEVERFEKAVRKSIEELEILKDEVLKEIGQKESNIFEAHLALLSDPEFVEKVKNTVSSDLINVDHAVHAQITYLETLLQGVKSEYVKERSRDVRDVGQRVLKHLAKPRNGTALVLSDLPAKSVLFAKDLFPSDTLQLKRENVIGIVTELGGPSSHAAILARSLGIPSITQVPGILKEVASGDHVLIDAENGCVILSPSARLLNQFRKDRDNYQISVYAVLQEEAKKCVTEDGLTISLLGNIGRVEEAPQIHEHFLDGVGLFRTEYLFLNSEHPPSLNLQYAAYQKVVRDLKKKPLTIRTLDLGADKIPPFVSRLFEKNISIGRRGLRFSLTQKHLFLTQLRAILRVSREGPVQVMFPMVLEAGDLNQAIEFVHEAAKREGIRKLPPIGAMIETPSAVFEIDAILKIADFVSIGTNDLTQFMVAADRNSVESIGEYTVLHPGVLKAVSTVLLAAKKHRRPATICGEVAGYPLIAALLIGLGVRNLSMGPVRAAPVHHAIRHVKATQLEKLAKKALSSSDVREVRALMDTFRKHLPQDACRK